MQARFAAFQQEQADMDTIRAEENADCTAAKEEEEAEKCIQENNFAKRMPTQVKCCQNTPL